jgi:hypothetical protein
MLRYTYTGNAKERLLVFVLSERVEIQSEESIGEVGVDGTEAAFGPERPESLLDGFCAFSLLGLTGFSSVPVSLSIPVPVPAPTSPGFMLSLLLSLSVNFPSFLKPLVVLDELYVACSTVVESA